MAWSIAVPLRCREAADDPVYRADEAGINAATLSRMENSGAKTVRGQGRSIQAVIDALAARGIEIEPDGLRMKPRKKGR